MKWRRRKYEKWREKKKYVWKKYEINDNEEDEMKCHM